MQDVVAVVAFMHSWFFLKVFPKVTGSDCISPSSSSDSALSWFLGKFLVQDSLAVRRFLQGPGRMSTVTALL